MTSGWGLVARGPNLVIRGLELSGPSPDLWGGEELRVESTTNGPRFNQSRLHDEASIITHTEPPGWST